MKSKSVCGNTTLCFFYESNELVFKLLCGYHIFLIWYHTMTAERERDDSFKKNTLLFIKKKGTEIICLFNLINQLIDPRVNHLKTIKF